MQLTAPPGCEQAARAFYGGLLGMAEVDKPPKLAERGGCWFTAGSQQVHVGVDPSFTPAGKAHPALSVESAAALGELGARLEAAGYEVSWDGSVDGWERCYVRDPFGNRLELVAEL